MRYRLFFITALICLALSACAKEEGTSLLLSEYNDAVGMESITYEFNGAEQRDKAYNLLFSVTNQSEADIEYGTRWTLEQNIDGSWYSIEMLEDPMFEDYSMLLAGETVSDVAVPLFYSYETPLAEGDYRVLQPVQNGILILEFHME